MICVSRVSEPLLGLRLPSLASRPSPKPTAAEGMPIARISATATTYRPGERRFKGASLVGFLSLMRHPEPRSGCGARADRSALQRRFQALALARLLGWVHRDRDREIQRRADDAVLLHRVRGRVALAGAGALGPADVAELEVARQQLKQARRHV